MKKFIVICLLIISCMMQTKGPQTPDQQISNENAIPFITGGRLRQEFEHPIMTAIQQQSATANHQSTQSQITISDSSAPKKDYSCLHCLCCCFSWFNKKNPAS